MTDVVVDQAAADAAQDDLGAFCRLVGRPLEWWQLAALHLLKWMTILIAPRQVGKSYSLALLAMWQAFRRPRQQILVISSVESSALDLLENCRDIAAHPALALSVTEALKFSIRLSNGSRIRSVTSTQSGIRGKSVDLLIADEAAYIDGDVLAAAAIPVTAARPAARIVVASTPWATAGVLYQWAMSGLDPDNPIMQSFTWALGQAPWISPAAIEAARQTLSPLQFRAEYEGEWVSGGDSFFSQEDIDAAVAAFPMSRDGGGAPAILGADWGGDVDLQAVVVAGVLDDGGVNGRPIIVVTWAEASRRGYTEQEDEIAALAGMWDLAAVMSECKGVGIPPTKNLRRRLRAKVVAVKTSQEIKEQAYAQLHHALTEGRIVFSDQGIELRKQLLGIVAKPTPMGGLRIEARTQAVHDDLADALAFAVWGLPEQLADPPEREFPEGTQWAQTPGGIRIPLPVSTVRADASYGALNGELTACGCGGPMRVAAPRCPHCGTPNAGYQVPKPEPAPAAVAAAPDQPAPNWWSQTMMQCGRVAGHTYDSRYDDQCPHCNPGGGSRRPRPGPQPGSGLPPGLSGRLGPFLGPGR
jgi:hypothetical protein